MQTFIEPLYKSRDQIQFGWSPEPGATAYAMYVGLSAGSLTKLYDGISNMQSKAPQNQGKVPYTATLIDVQALLSTAQNFTDDVFYFAITYYVGAVESALSGSRVVAVPPVGISSVPMKDDPMRMRQQFAFSPEIQRWVKVAASSSGAIAVSTSDYFQANMVTEYTYDTTNVATIKTYPADATTAGSPAKLTTNTWVGSQLTKTVVTDSTV